jgi:hypothetical protein
MLRDRSSEQFCCADGHLKQDAPRISFHLRPGGYCGHRRPAYTNAACLGGPSRQRMEPGIDEVWLILGHRTRQSRVLPLPPVSRSGASRITAQGTAADAFRPSRYCTAFSHCPGRHARGPFRRGIDQLKQVLRLDPDLVAARVNLGLAYHATGDYRLAVAELGQASKQSPDLLPASLFLGLSYLKLGFPGKRFLRSTTLWSLTPRTGGLDAP